MALVFFYGTLMAGFDRRARAGLDAKLSFLGRGWILATLFDLGLYPAAVPSAEHRVWGELYEVSDPATVFAALDEIEGYTPSDPDRSLYLRQPAVVTLNEGRTEEAWVYFYNAPLGRAPRILSGDYVAHQAARRPR